MFREVWETENTVPILQSPLSSIQSDPLVGGGHGAPENPKESKLQFDESTDTLNTGTRWCSFDFSKGSV